MRGGEICVRQVREGIGIGGGWEWGGNRAPCGESGRGQHAHVSCGECMRW